MQTQSQVPGTPSRSLAWLQLPKDLLLSQEHLQGAGSESGWGFEPMLTWDAGIAGDSLTRGATTPATSVLTVCVITAQAYKAPGTVLQSFANSVLMKIQRWEQSFTILHVKRWKQYQLSDLTTFTASKRSNGAVCARDHTQPRRPNYKLQVRVKP